MTCLFLINFQRSSNYFHNERKLWHYYIKEIVITRFLRAGHLGYTWQNYGYMENFGGEPAGTQWGWRSWSEITPSVPHGTNEQCPGDPGLVMAAREEVDIYIGEEHVPLLLPLQESYETPASETTWSTNSRIRLEVAHPWCPGENPERQMFFSSVSAWGDPILSRKGL